jgi:GxxExxY protein
MPISCPIAARAISQEEFARIDYRVMGGAFDSQNQLGRLCDETIYSNDLAARLRAEGMEASREVPVTVSHLDFAKTYRLDLVVGNAAVYELKTEAKLVGDHEAQLLNYLFLFGGQHGKLVNFRSPQVESRFVNTTLTLGVRREIEVEEQRWREPNEASRLLRARLLGMLQDWGAFLDLPLYTEALTCFLGGEATVARTVPLERHGLRLGNQRMHLAAPDTGFRLTAIPEGTAQYEPHLRSLLSHSSLNVIQWINMAHHRIQFVTLQK